MLLKVLNIAFLNCLDSLQNYSHLFYLPNKPREVTGRVSYSSKRILYTGRKWWEARNHSNLDCKSCAVFTLLHSSTYMYINKEIWVTERKAITLYVTVIPILIFTNLYYLADTTVIHSGLNLQYPWHCFRCTRFHLIRTGLFLWNLYSNRRRTDQKRWWS